ncbi:MAG: ABC transporter permease [Planctomycetes bacterium]|nr:ABC transporter permease [Planctomycetota bacterium]
MSAVERDRAGDRPGRRGWLGFQPNEWLLACAILVVLVGASVADVNHTYWMNPRLSALDIARQTAFLGIFALGAAVVIIAGGIDLSAGSMIAFSGTMCATFLVLLAPEVMRNPHELIDGKLVARPLGAAVITLAVSGTILIGFLVGTLHTWLITAVGLPPFIATLATLVGLRSLSRAVCESVTQSVFQAKSTQIQIFDPTFRYLATSVWIPMLIFVVLAVAIGVLLRRTVVGRHLYALGGNEQAARLSGIHTSSVKWLAYSLGAVTSAVAGILYIGDQSVADPQTLGRGYELNAIAAAVVGGCSLQGGIGTVSGTFLGALFLRCVIDGIAKIIKTGADIYEGQIVGVVVVIAVAFSQWRTAAGRGRQAFPGVMGGVAVVTLGLLAAVLAMLMTEQIARFVPGAQSLDPRGTGVAFGLIVAIGLAGWKFAQETRR